MKIKSSRKWRNHCRFTDVGKSHPSREFLTWLIIIHVQSLRKTKFSQIISEFTVSKHLGLIARKPVFGVADKASFKPVSSTTETG